MFLTTETSTVFRCELMFTAENSASYIAIVSLQCFITEHKLNNKMMKIKPLELHINCFKICYYLLSTLLLAVIT